MQIPLQVTFHNMPHSSRATQQIEMYAAGLEEFYDRITSCRVVVDIPHRHHEWGNLYQVRIDVTVPGGEIVVNRDGSPREECKDLFVAIGHAFDVAARKLEDYAARHRAFVKHHDPPPRARVARLFPEGRYGFLQTPDDREIFFHANSLARGAYDDLTVGTEVTFSEELGDKGPQATTVKIVGRHNHV